MDLLVPVALPPVSRFAPVLTFGVRPLVAAFAQASLLAAVNLRLPKRRQQETFWRDGGTLLGGVADLLIGTDNT